MDCNRDEAARAKTVALSKLEQMEYTNALRFANKAQTLDPTLQGISQIVATLDVLVSSQKTINGEVDWYSILRVDPTSDDDTIKRHYKRLALLTHPDKNPYAAANTAFKLITEAKNLLLDTGRRRAYDLSTALRSPARSRPSNPPAQPTGSSSGPNQPPAPAAKWAREDGTRPMRTEPVIPAEDVFWTLCHHCKVRFEYLRIFQNMLLVCTNCHGTFMSFEIPWPESKSRMHEPRPWARLGEDGSIRGARHMGMASYAYAMYKRGPLFGMGGSGGGARTSVPTGTEGQLRRQI